MNRYQQCCISVVSINLALSFAAFFPVPLLANTDDPKVRAVFADIRATKRIDRIPNVWRALAAHPEHLELCWTRLKAIMSPGKLDVLTKEIIALAVSATNGCNYCINRHTAAVQKLGLDNQGLGELLAVVGLYNQMNKLADAYQVEPDVLPEPR